MTGRIDLGLVAPLRLGRLRLEPAVRSIRRDDGAEETVEPRVMQVLIALAETRGEIVRREELTERCWEGRVVGEDAINRVLSRLRRVAEGIGIDSFRIETVTRIGYRLIELGEAASLPSAVAPAPPPAPATPPLPDGSASPTRRRVLRLAGSGGMALAIGGGWWLWTRPRLPAAAQAAMDRGMAALKIGEPNDFGNAVAAFREAAQIAPDAAEPWGKLALAYRAQYQIGHGQTAMQDAQRAREAAAKALAIDRDNGDAQAALATLQAIFGNWRSYEAALKPVVDAHPREIAIELIYMHLTANVGRIRETLARARQIDAIDAGWTLNHSNLMMSSWCLGRLDDTDAAMARARALWPRNSRIWFTSQRILAYSGRGAAALALIADVDNRPAGIPDWNYELARLESQALLTRAPADIEAAAALYRERARTAVGITNNGVQFFAALGRLDDAIAFLEALYFGRGFDPGNQTYSVEQGVFSERRDRPTWLFWQPFMAGLRADPRLGAILTEIGLIDYWRRSGQRPDFPIAGLPRL